MENSNVQNANLNSSSNKKEICPNCGSDEGFKAGTVLDIFMGSGTTLKVARDLGRKGIGIELNPEYIGLAEKRINLQQAVFGL